MRKELAALKRLGERNYFDINLGKTKQPQRVGDISLLLKKTDPKRNKYTIEVLADDKTHRKEGQDGQRAGAVPDVEGRPAAVRDHHQPGEERSDRGIPGDAERNGLAQLISPAGWATNHSIGNADAKSLSARLTSTLTFSPSDKLPLTVSV